MTDKDIAKLASKLTLSLATKGDIKKLESKMDDVDARLGGKMDELDKKADIILEFAEAVDETTADHEKRLKRIEAIPVIAHQIKK